MNTTDILSSDDIGRFFGGLINVYAYDFSRANVEFGKCMRWGRSGHPREFYSIYCNHWGYSEEGGRMILKIRGYTQWQVFHEEIIDDKSVDNLIETLKTANKAFNACQDPQFLLLYTKFTCTKISLEHFEKKTQDSLPGCCFQLVSMEELRKKELSIPINIVIGDPDRCR